MTGLQSSAVAFLVAPEGAEQQELTAHWETVTQAGTTARLTSTEPGRVQTFRHLDRGDTFPSGRGGRGNLGRRFRRLGPAGRGRQSRLPRGVALDPVSVPARA